MDIKAQLDALPEWAIYVLVPLVIVQVVLEVWALLRLFVTPEERLVFGKRWPWLLIIVLVNTIGPIVFLVAGRTPAPAGEAAHAEESIREALAARAADVLYGKKDGDAT